jgi:hypothetical protein
MPILLGLCWGITMLATLLSGLLEFGVYERDPEDVAGGVLSLAIAVLPFIFTCSLHAFVAARQQRKIMDALAAREMFL